MFQGGSALSLDAKGRLTVPARHREALMGQCEGRLTITKGLDGCLWLFPRSAWELFRRRVEELPMSARAWQRMFLGYAVEVEIDAAGRLLIPPELRDAAALVKDVMLLGVGPKFEIWDSKRYAEQEEQAVAAGMPESLQNFTF